LLQRNAAFLAHPVYDNFVSFETGSLDTQFIPECSNKRIIKIDPHLTTLS